MTRPRAAQGGRRPWLAGLLLAASLRIGTAHADATWTAVETIPQAWEDLTLVVEKSADENADDPIRVRIVSREGPALLVTPEGGLATMKESMVPPGLTADNRITSAYAYMSPRLHGPHNTPALVLFGHAFASNPGSLTVVALGPAGRPRVAFKADTFQLDRIMAVAGSDVLVGIRSLAGQSGRCTTYNPAAAFRFGPALATVRYDPALSRQATLAAGGPWAGPDASQSILLLHTPGGPARIVPARGCR